MFRRRFSIYLIGLAVFCLLLISKNNVSKADTNIILNPSAENVINNQPQYWSHIKSGNNIAVFQYATNGQDGKRSLKIDTTTYKTGEAYWKFDNVSVTSDTTYKYSVYYKSSVDTELYALNNSKNTLFVSKVSKSSDWKQFTINYKVPSGVSKITFYHSIKAVGSIQLDNFSLSQTSEVPSPTPPITPTPTILPTVLPTPIVVPSPTTQPTPTVVPSVIPTIVPTVVPSPSPTIIPSPTIVPSPSPTPTIIPSPSPSPTVTPIPTPSPTPTPTISLNPIPNPSLEIVSSNNQALPKNWFKAKSGTNNATFSYLNSGAHTGSRALRIDVTNYTSGVAYYYFDTALIKGGKTYEYSTYYKSDSYAEVDAEVTLSTGEVIYQYLGVSYPSSEWSKFSTRISMPSNAVSVSIYNMIYSKGYLVTDDYALTELNTVGFARPIVTFTFDDFFTSFYTTIFPMFKPNNYKGTIFLLTQDIGTTGTLSSTQINELYNYGFEIGSHTVTHAHLPFISYAEVENELFQSKNTIMTSLGITPINFASPYGEYNDTVKTQIAKYYRSHRSVDVGYNSKDSFDIMNIRAMSPSSVTSPEEVLGWVDQAIKDKTWLVIVYHDISNTGGTWVNTPAHLQTVVNGVKARNVTVKTINEALDEIVPQL